MNVAALRFSISLSLLLIAGLSGQFTSRAEAKPSLTTLKDVLGQVAADIRKWMDEQGGKSEISVGTINQPPGITTGRGVGQLLTERLRLSNLIVKLGNTPHYIEGRISQDKSTGELVFQFTLFDDNGKEKYRVPEQRLPLVETIEAGEMGTTGTNGGAMLAAGITAPGKATVVQLKQPESLIGIEGKEVFAKGADLYRLEVQKKVGEKYQAIEPVMQDGFAVVKMPSDSVFAVNLINNSPEDVAIILEIDGVNFFVLCEATTDLSTKSVTVSIPKYTHYCLNKTDKVLIAGYYKNETTSFEFRATDDRKELEEKAPSFKSQDRSRLGTISAQFYRAWDPKETQPALAVLAEKFQPKFGRKGVLGAVPGKETDVTKSELRTVVWEEMNRATISVRYEKE